MRTTNNKVRSSKKPAKTARAGKVDPKVLGEEMLESDLR